MHLLAEYNVRMKYSYTSPNRHYLERHVIFAVCKVQHTIFAILLQFTYANVIFLKDNFILFTIIKKKLYFQQQQNMSNFSKGRLHK